MFTAHFDLKLGKYSTSDMISKAIQYFQDCDKLFVYNLIHIHEASRFCHSMTITDLFSESQWGLVLWVKVVRVNPVLVLDVKDI